MTDDIVKRLNDAYGFLRDPLFKDAADEIKRLRAKLQEIRDLHHDDDDIFIRDDVTYEIVCEALGVEDDSAA